MFLDPLVFLYIGILSEEHLMSEFFFFIKTFSMMFGLYSSTIMLLDILSNYFSGGDAKPIQSTNYYLRDSGNCSNLSTIKFR